MAEDSLRIGGLSSGLAVILNSGDGKENPSKPRLVSYSDEFGQQSVERALEYVFGLPNKSIGPLSGPVDSSLVRSIIKNYLYSDSDSLVSNRDGVCISDNGSGPGVIGLEKFSICGEIRIVKPPLLLESLAVFSSARANAYVWKGKWMYEVILETSGIQQLGWATISCPFTDHKGVGDADDSYAFDGRRVRKWNKEAEPYGQPWVAGDVIGCCIDLAHDEISFYRNGVSLGVAFSGIRKMGPGFGYHPAVSLSQGERCELNFGARPFKYPIDGYHPLQAPPSSSSFVKQLLDCLSRLLDMQSVERAEHSSVERLRRLKRFVSLEELFYPVSHGICEEFFSVVEADCQGAEYIGWGPLLLFFMGVFGVRAPHDWLSLDRVLDVFLEFQGSHVMFEHIINALSCACKTASLVLTECPYSGSYSYLALVCHLLRREQLMVLWWKSSDFGFLFEGFLSRKSPNRQDLQCMIPSVWWPGSCEDVSTESSMLLATTALSDAVSKIEEKHRDLCLLVIQFIPALSPPQFPGSVFRTFVQNLLLKYRGADRNMPPPGILSNSVLVSLYTVILHFLSEGFGVGNICGWLKSCDSSGHDIGFLHRGGCQSFPIGLFLKNDPHRAELSRLGGSFSHLSKSHPMHDQEAEVIRWEEGCMDDEETRVTHLTKQKPCCCSWYDMEFTKCSKYPIRTTTKSSRHNCSAIPERSAQVAAECSTGSLNEEISDKPSSSDQSESEFGYRPVQHMRTVPRDSDLASTTLREEELLDALLLLYHIGLAPNFKQASYYMSHQSQSISLLEETDKQIRERACKEQLKRLKETRNNYREEVIDCVRHCAWYRVSLFSRWKQRGMYATCMWVVQLLLVLSKLDSVFIYIPEFYLEALVDCFHVLRKSDPPFVPPAIFIKQGPRVCALVSTFLLAVHILSPSVPVSSFHHSSHSLSASYLFSACSFLSLPSMASSASVDDNIESNPLLQDFDFPPFDFVEAKHVRPGIRALLKKLESDLDELEKTVEPSWPKLVEPLEKIVDRLTVVWGIVNHLKAVKDTAELRAAIEEVQPEKVKFQLRVGQSKPIYNAFKAIQESPDWKSLNEARKRIVETQIKEAVLNGVSLEDDKREQFNKIEQELERLSHKFSENVLDATKKFEKLITDKKEIEGLPATSLGLAAQTAVSKGHENATAEHGPWMITLDAPCLFAVMQHARNRALREEVYRANITRASTGDLDNTPIINQILKLRMEKARLLNYNNYAEVSMATKMATVDKAEELLEKLRSASWNAAVQDIEDLKSYSKSQGALEADNLSHWDINFWSERLRESKYNINEEELRPYFSLSKVMDGLFKLAKTLFGIDIEPADGLAPVWNKDVRFYRVKDSSGSPIAYFYFDPYSRPSEKREGAWMDEVVSRSRVMSRNGTTPRLPIAHMVCNQTPPFGDKPSLMTFREVETVFHEFGHALQHMLTKQDEGLVAGIRGIEWDAVELPSQFMENWCYHRDTLMSIAKHYETGESLPEEVYLKLLAARTFRAGSLSLRQLRFASVDLELHTKYIPDGSESVFDVDQRVSKKTQVIPPLPEDRFLCGFNHIFAGGYAAGYYSYKWAEVLSADAFSAFEDVGLDNTKAVKETGHKFRETILALGGGKAPSEVFVEFRGREPSPEALLRHNGLLPVAA